MIRGKSLCSNEIAPSDGQPTLFGGLAITMKWLKSPSSNPTRTPPQTSHPTAQNPSPRSCCVPPGPSWFAIALFRCSHHRPRSIRRLSPPRCSARRATTTAKPKRQPRVTAQSDRTTMISVSEDWIDQMWASFSLEQKAAGISAAMEL